MLVIRKAQMEQFRVYALEQFVAALAVRLRAQEPPRYTARFEGDEALRAFVRHCVPRAAAAGYVSESHVHQFARLMLRLDLAANAPLPGWITSILKDERLPSEARLAEAVYRAALGEPVNLPATFDVDEDEPSETD